MENSNIYLAFLLSLLAGLSTGIGSLMAFLSKKFNPKFLAGSLGFSAGVMIYVSFVEIFPQAKEELIRNFNYQTGYLYTVLAFFAGIALIAIIDKFVPSYENPHEIKNISIGESAMPADKKLIRMGLFSALAIALHNFSNFTFWKNLKEGLKFSSFSTCSYQSG